MDSAIQQNDKKLQLDLLHHKLNWSFMYSLKSDYSIFLTTAFGASFREPSKPSTPATVVYFIT